LDARSLKAGIALRRENTRESSGKEGEKGKPSLSRGGASQKRDLGFGNTFCPNLMRKGLAKAEEKGRQIEGGGGRSGNTLL